MTLTAGATLQHGRYLIQSIWAKTEQDTTYKALHSYLGHTVLIKSLPEQYWCHFAEDSSRHYFNHKVALFAQSPNQSLVNIFDGFEEQGVPFLVLLPPHGQTLATWLHQKQPLSLQETIALLRPLVTSLNSLHQMGIVHGYLNEQSLFIHDDSQDLMLGDIVLSSFLPDEAIAQIDQSLVQNPTAVRTRLARDIQGLAATACTLLTGTPRAFQEITSQNPTLFLQDYARHIAPNLQQVIAQGLDPISSATVSDWFHAFENVTTGHDAVINHLTNHLANQSSMPLPPSFDAFPSSLAEGMTVVKSAGTSTIHPSWSKTQSMPASTTDLRKQQSPSTQKTNRRWRLPIIFGSASILAASVGGYLGLSLRLQEPEQLERSLIFGQEIFGTEQSFPESNQWPGTSAYEADVSRFFFEDRTPRSLYSAPREDELILPDTEPDDLETLQSEYGFSDDFQIGSDFDDPWGFEDEPTIKDDNDSTHDIPEIEPAPVAPEIPEPEPSTPDKFIREVPPPSDVENWPSLLDDASAGSQSGQSDISAPNTNTESSTISLNPDGLNSSADRTSSFPTNLL
ncbi:MAG: hypothetical protein AAF327_00400 [Cyanobacteria bacterium P01_A01_bin.37]